MEEEAGEGLKDPLLARQHLHHYDDDDDDSLLSGSSAPLSLEGEPISEFVPLPKARNQTFAQPRIMLETLTSKCALGVFLLVYLTFGLCTLLILFEATHTKKSIDLVPIDPCHSSNSSSFTPSSSSSSFSCLDHPSHGPYRTIFYANMSVSDLIGEVTLYAAFNVVDTNCFNGSLPALVEYDVAVSGCIDSPSACQASSPSVWHQALSTQRNQAYVSRSLTVELFSYYQNQEVLANFGSIHGYQIMLKFRDSQGGIFAAPLCPVVFTLQYGTVYSSPFFRIVAVVNILIGIILLGAWVYWLYWRQASSNSSPPSFGTKHHSLSRVVERDWLTFFLVGLLFYQNPFYCFGQWLPKVPVVVMFLSSLSASLGQVIFFIVWLLFVDGFRQDDASLLSSTTTWLPKLALGLALMVGEVGMAVLSYPSLFDPGRSPLLSFDNWDKSLSNEYLAFLLIFVVSTFMWFAYFFYLSYATAAKFQKMVYLQTRYRQLSFRFFFLQSILVAGAYLIQYVYFFTRDFITETSQNALQVNNFVNSLLPLLLLQTQPVGKIVFITFYAYLLLYLHLPPSHIAGSTLITTTHVALESEHRALMRQMKKIIREKRKKKKKRKRRLLLLRDSHQEENGRDSAINTLVIKDKVCEDEEEEEENGRPKPSKNPVALLAHMFEHRRQIPPVFCIETAMGLMELSWQAYYDVPGKRRFKFIYTEYLSIGWSLCATIQATSGGYGDIDLDQLGYDLIEALSDEEYDTFALIMRHRGDGRVVVAFRGSSSKKQWLNNLRFKQIQLDFEDLPHIQYDQIDWVGTSYDDTQELMPQASPEDTGAPVGEEGHEARPRQSMDDPATMLTEVVAAGAEIIQQTGDLVVEGVRNTAHMLHIDRIPGVKRLFAGFVHKGFFDAYRYIRPHLHRVVHKALCNQPAHLYFTGHSLGGALATLAAIDLSINTIPVVEAELARRNTQIQTSGTIRRSKRDESKILVSLYSFGSPRVFNPALAQRCNKLIPDSFRVVADGDVVTGMPPWLPTRSYKHVGTEVVVDGYGSGSLVIDPSFMERRLRINSKRRLAEHTMNFYRRALEGCMAVTRLAFLGEKSPGEDSISQVDDRESVMSLSADV